MKHFALPSSVRTGARQRRPAFAKELALGLAAGLALTFAGCVVMSVYPFYTAKDIAFEPALLGAWTNTTAPDQHWTFEKDGNAYRLACVDSDERTVMRAQGFKLDGKLFLDLSRTNAAREPFPPPIPSHVLLRVLQSAPSLRMAAPKFDWVKELLEKNPNALRHHVVQPAGKPEEEYFVLTADTAELQRFILENLKTDALWQDQFELKRSSAPPDRGAGK